MRQQEPVSETIRFGKYLRDVREERRLSLDQVEEMSLTLSERVTKSHLSRIENGQATPSFPRLFTLSQIYGIPVSFIAERFELCLRAGAFPAEATVRPLDAVLEEARKLRRQGRHGEALVLYEAMLERKVEIAKSTSKTPGKTRSGCTASTAWSSSRATRRPRNSASDS